MSDADWVLSAATVVLAIITGYYARQTQRLVTVPYRPSLIPILFPNPLQNNGFALRLKIENIGVGIATDVKMKY